MLSQVELNWNTDSKNKYRSISYPADLLTATGESDAPFIFLGVYEFKALINASDYKKSIVETEGKNYIQTFAFYVPKSLKYSYNPTIGEVSARVDRNLTDGLKSMNVGQIARGAVATGVNMLALDQNGSMLGQALNLFKEYRQVTTGRIMDPKQLNMFKDAPFMSYNLSYKIIPETLTEAADVDFMLKMLRYWSMANMGKTSTFRQLLDVKSQLSGEAKNMELADRDRKKEDRINELLESIANDPTFNNWGAVNKDGNVEITDYVSLINRRLGGKPDHRFTEILETSYEYAENKSLSPKDNKDMYQKKIVESIKKSVAQRSNAANDNRSVAKKTWDAFQLSVGEAYEALMNATFDLWKHPQLFDLYVVVPGSDADGTMSVSSNREMDMFKYAKGLILSNLDISMIESPNRDDIPFHDFGFPVGWELNMTFTSTSKMVGVGENK